MIAWFNLPLGYLLFLLRKVFSPFTRLQKNPENLPSGVLVWLWAGPYLAYRLATLKPVLKRSNSLHMVHHGDASA